MQFEVSAQRCNRPADIDGGKRRPAPVVVQPSVDGFQSAACRKYSAADKNSLRPAAIAPRLLYSSAMGRLSCFSYASLAYGFGIHCMYALSAAQLDILGSIVQHAAARLP